MSPTPSSITTRGPRRSIRRPRVGLRTAETRKPKENAPACYAPLPAELVEDRREEQREGGARVGPHANRDEGDGDDDPAVEEGQCQRIRFAGGSPRAARRIFSAKVPAKATRSMAAFSAWSGGESITSEVIGGRTASAYIGGRGRGTSSTSPWRARSLPRTRAFSGNPTTIHLTNSRSTSSSPPTPPPRRRLPPPPYPQR